jgi:hypothetical protein
MLELGARARIHFGLAKTIKANLFWQYGLGQDHEITGRHFLRPTNKLTDILHFISKFVNSTSTSKMSPCCKYLRCDDIDNFRWEFLLILCLLLRASLHY